MSARDPVVHASTPPTAGRVAPAGLAGPFAARCPIPGAAARLAPAVIAATVS